ncbi:hypothetical protein GCM10022394_14230 [Zobellella aerophila]|uniref:O-antigen polymerase n=1 Tax=Zobellella aerophila TaxID=870480 RepID=A0ABP6VL59_9GAMM
MLFFSPLICWLSFEFVSELLSNDVSFSSKFHIIELTFDYIERSSWFEFFFGVGLGNAVNAIGIGSHNILITFLIETGVVGFVFFVSINVFLMFKLKSDFLIIALPFMISSLSLGSTAIPYYFSLVSICILHRSGFLVVTGLNSSVVKNT